jgi:hypothetical protein
MVAVNDDAQGGLFDVPELQALPNARRAEAGLMLALRAATAAGQVLEVDGGLVSAALIAARTLDEAETIRNPKDRAYAVTALLPPYQRALHGLGLPLERAPAAGPAVPVPTGEGSAAPSWLGDAFGPE